MTTICFKDGVLAADTALTDNGIKAGQISKARRLPGGSIAAAAGQSQLAAAFFEWLADGAQEDGKPQMEDGFEGMKIAPDGTLTTYETMLVGYTWQPIDGIWAVGSGRRIALGAMMAGASAEEACRIACRLDDGSAEPVEVFRLGQR